MIDLSNEMILQPYGKGLQLIRPDNPPDNNQLSVSLNLRDALSLPLNVYLLDKNSTILTMNDECILTCGYPSLKKSIGKTRDMIAKKEVVDKITIEDRQVIQYQSPCVFEEYFILLDDIGFSAVALKIPLYDQDKKLAGLLGFSIQLNRNNFASIVKSVALLLKIELSIRPKNKEIFFQGLMDDMSHHKNTISLLSRREKECLFLIGKGKTTKMIAKQLNLSPRTVEHYIESIKIKTNVYSKYHLMEYAHRLFSNI
jgi:DNA-binding CsgD family transcriptional regulator